MTSLRQKLIIYTMVTISAVFLLMMVLFISFINHRTSEQITKTTETAQEALETKARLLASDKALSWRILIEDNSRGDVLKLVTDTVNIDPDIIEAGYVRADYKPWVWVSPEYPKGMPANDEVLLKNNTTEWALKLEDYNIRDTTDFIECASPIRIESYDDFDENGDPMMIVDGAVIYRLSKSIMKKTIMEETAANEYTLKLTIMISLVLAIGILAFSFVATQRQAGRITQPLGILTAAADTIASGNYSIEVAVKSGDEIETLALSFNQMAKDLDATYADIRTKNRQLEMARSELEDLNKHLEEKVEERTYQLKESESKFRTLFEESADAIILGTEDRLLDCNPAMLEMIECSGKEAFLKLRPDDLSPEYQPDGSNSSESLHTFYSRARNGGSQHFEWVNKRTDGTEFPTEIVITSFPLNGESVLHMVLRDITERKQTEQALKEAQQKLVETAHGAGMAEIATGVLHNIGNILNSVNISTEEISSTLKTSKIKGFLKANNLVSKNMETISSFFSEHPKGKLIPGYYVSIGEAIKEEHELMAREIIELTNKVSMMRDVISTQQSYAKASLYTENVAISSLVDDAIKLQIASLNKAGVRLTKDYRDKPSGSVPKVKLIHVLTNLIKNSKEAMLENEELNKTLEMTIAIKNLDSMHAEITVTDNGCGIRPENIDKIFNHGFTTKSDGHGFGLHTCANFLTEMGGTLTVDSEGPGHGSTFFVRFPLVCKGPKQGDFTFDEDEEDDDMPAEEPHRETA